MEFKKLIPMLWTDKLNESLEFYTGILGFTQGERRDDWGWAAVYRDDIEIMLAVPNEHIPFERSIFTGTFYIYTDQVDELWEDIKEKVKVLYPIDDFEYGMREFAIYDNNGYMLQFGKSMNEDG